MSRWKTQMLCLLALFISFIPDFIPSGAVQAAAAATAVVDPSPSPEQKQEKLFVLPASLQMIGEDAFGGSAAEAVLLPMGLEKIDKKAFGDMERLQSVYIPETVTEIDRHAFSDAGKPVLIGRSGSRAESWARENRHVFSGGWVLRFRLRAGSSEIRAVAERPESSAAPERQRESVRPERRQETTGRPAENRVMKKEFRSELNHLVGLFP